MNQAKAKIIASSTAGDTVAASGGRISTTQGTALEIYARSCEKENNASLIEKVVGSGHTSTLEHQFFTVAFDSVSVFTEEFVIEFRLGSYTVQSRRYVDYTNVGFYVPPLDAAMRPRFAAHMQSLFDDYAKLLELGIPKEDARFVLPYCFRSNFYCTMNARELIYMVLVMTKGRGSGYPELRMLGESLKEQLRDYFPNVPDLLAKHYPPAGSRTPDRYAVPDAFPALRDPHTEAAAVQLRTVAPENPVPMLQAAAGANWAVSCEGETACPVGDIICGERPRELELVHVQFGIRDLSLAAVTHLVRHRIQTVLVPHITEAVLKNSYLLPESVKANPEAEALYRGAFRRNTETARALLAEGLAGNVLQYFALAGNQLDVECAMNGRELLHFMKLRTCTRAQWEIRACAVSLLRQLREKSPELFLHYGPSCYVTGACPEGRLSCGKIAAVREQYSAAEIPDLQ